MNKKWFLGVDTSCYTTSVAAVDAEGNILGQARRLLSVPMGQRGLRQSEALFQHIERLPELLSELSQQISPGQPAAIAASKTPRPQPGSYMPVFMAGYRMAAAWGAIARIPVHPVSHQEGHLRAALVGTDLAADRFLAVHLSGGTTELLLITRKPGGYGVELLGGTNDLHAGQMVDRVGVAMGLPFPAGPALEELAQSGEPGKVRIRAAVKGLEVSFSGPAAAAERLLQTGALPADVALGVLECLVESLALLLKQGIQDTGLPDVLIFGGVAANGHLRARLPGMVPNGRIYFGDPRLSGDNAVGVALLAAEKGGDPLER
ncbi:MAG TPA: O-sialoglycoprotein endopeptidase [Firmicutes bacterium]|jgi:N6-L-threonylcarbamoyladenine synthase|nr:O-sialoglycoprotein endopeptidase [Bacillota bacterium]HOQ23196.1 O-sialoglycoprotein endopeptidase [Bacillota bacterium]HPT66625.1 O-sialoglycoprotein endopeptidase [Bacillota bacterium]